MLTDFLNPYYLQIGSFILINIILGVSIYVTLASGQLSLGNAGFMGIGAYTSALLTINYQVPLVIAVIVGAIFAGILGILVGIPALRLHGVYLAIATLGFGEVIRVIFINWESLTNGAIGVAGIPQLGQVALQPFETLGIDAGSASLRGLAMFVILLIIVIGVIWFFVRQGRSRIGRAYAAIKMDEQAAEAMGINITYYKVLGFAQGALLSGFAGALYAHVLTYINPGDFAYHKAVEILIFAIFGGSEVIWGPVFGSTILTLLPEALRGISEYRDIIYGIILIVMMAFRPQGLLDERILKIFKRSKKRSKGRVDHGSGNKKSL